MTNENISDRKKAVHVLKYRLHREARLKESFFQSLLYAPALQSHTGTYLFSQTRLLHNGRLDKDELHYMQDVFMQVDSIVDQVYKGGTQSHLQRVY